MPFDDIPLSLISTQRGTGTGDRRMVNALSEVVVDALKKEAYFSVIKRPGLANSTQPPAGAATGRGIYAWGATGAIYTCFDGKLYKGASDLGATLAGSSGRVWFAETPATASTQLLVVSDGADNYNIETDDTTTQIDEGDDADYPTANQGSVVFLDSYLFQCQSNGKIWQSDLNDFDNWSDTGFLSAAAKGDALEAVHVQRDRLLGLGKKSIESYYNRGRPTGSILQRIEQNRLSFGLSAKETMAWVGDLLMFVGESQEGARSVWMLQGGEIKEVSDSVVNRFLNAEGTSLSSASAWMGHAAGQLVYVLNLSSADRTFVYNVATQRWDGEWEDAAGGSQFNGAYATQLNGTTYVQDAANGRVYTFPPTTYQDSETTFTVTLQTEGRDQKTSNRKTIEYVELEGDTQTSGTATLEYSDDDFQSWVTLGTFDLTEERKRIHRGGTYKGKRAWRLTHAANTAFRAKRLRVKFEVEGA